METTYIPVIGMEIHAELKTRSKMFCGCKNDQGLEEKPNVHICPLCTGQPGTLPVPNKEAVAMVQKVGLAVEGTLRRLSKFDRKNYFYPDLPKGYQISQYDQPLVEKGRLQLRDGKEVRITRIHLEEDTGKSQHPKGASFSLVDFNRSGVPLMELVTEPDIENGAQAREFCQRLQQILRYLEVSDADMEKGQMRCEANVSLVREGENRLSGTKVEIKNLNSFKAVERAILYEIERQKKLLEEGKQVRQETRGWDENRQETVAQRTKESAHDYRYFPEPDIPPLEFSEEAIESLRRSLPELPQQKERRFQEEFGVREDQAILLAEDKEFASYTEAVMSELAEKKQSGEFQGDLKKAQKLAANYLLTELRRFLAESEASLDTLRITPENFAELITLVAEEKVNSSAAQEIFAHMARSGGDPSHIMEERGLQQVSDEAFLRQAIKDVLAKNPKPAEDYRAGKEKALGFLVGQVMKETRGKAHPAKVQELLRSELAQDH